MILGADGHKLSKRHGAASRSRSTATTGYLPDTLVNFLALLGWCARRRDHHHPARRAVPPSSASIASRSKDAILDETKLDWMNGQYIQRMGADCMGCRQPHPGLIAGRPHHRGRRRCASPDWYAKLYPLVAERLQRLDRGPCEARLHLLTAPSVAELDEKSVKKVPARRKAARADEALARRHAPSWPTSPAPGRATRPCKTPAASSPNSIDMKAEARAPAAPRGRALAHMVSPPLFESIELMDRADVVARLDYTINEVFGA